MSRNLEKTDLIITVISGHRHHHTQQRTTRRTTRNDFNDFNNFNNLLRALRLATNHFQLSFQFPFEREARYIDEFVNLCEKQYFVIVYPVNWTSEKFLVKSKDWNFIECADCKWDTYCDFCGLEMGYPSSPI